MEIIVSVIAACLIAIPYRHFKIRYRLISYDNSDTCFYGTDEMAEAYQKQKLNKTKMEEN